MKATKAPKGFLMDFRICQSADELLAMKGWEDGFSAGNRVNPDFGKGVRILIERECIRRDGDPPEAAKRTLVAELRRQQREEEEAQRDLFPLEDIAKTRPEKKLEVLHRHWPNGLWTDENGPVTVSRALEDSELGLMALEMFRDRASRAKANWRVAVFELAVFANLMAEEMGEARPTRAQLEAFYGRTAWKHACGVVFSKDGKFCCECGSLEGPFHVHHVAKLKDCWPLRLDPANLQIVCEECHPEEEQNLADIESQREKEPEPA